MASQFLSLLKGKCPQCKKRSIFNTVQGLFFLSIPEMDQVCKIAILNMRKNLAFSLGLCLLVMLWQ